MKILLFEFRMYLAERVLGFAYALAPEQTAEGRELKDIIISYFNFNMRMGG